MNEGPPVAGSARKFDEFLSLASIFDVVGVLDSCAPSSELSALNVLSLVLPSPIHHRHLAP